MAIINLRGALVDILCKISSYYKDYVTSYKRGAKHLLLRYQNTLYGKMVASLLYNHKFTKSLTSIGFEINTYDPCVANKVIDGSQMITSFNVDACNMSNCERKANAHIIIWFCQEYEIIFEDGSGKMSVSQGKVHEYLGRTLDYTICGQVKTTMFSYIEDILTTLNKSYMKGRVTKSRAFTNNIFVVNKYCKKLDQEKVVEFKHLVAKTLCANNRSRTDTCTSTTFLTTKVRAPNEDN